MSKTRNKNRSEVEHLRGQNKQLQSENRQLRKQLNSFKKQAHFYEETIDDIADEISLESCNHCGKGFIQVVDLTYLKIRCCTICDYKERIRSNGKETE